MNALAELLRSTRVHKQTVERRIQQAPPGGETAQLEDHLETLRKLETVVNTRLLAEVNS